MTAPKYDPEALFPIKEFDVDYFQDGDTKLLARVYQPDAQGPFPVLLDVHGGAWNSGDRLNNVVFNSALAQSGILVVAIDFRLAPDYAYPTQVADQNYATRWLKGHASEFGGDPATLGAVGSSSGGHTILLSAMRPKDSRYAAMPLATSPGVDATLDYIVLLWPVVDPYARYLFAKSNPEAGTGFGGPEVLQERTLAFFLTEDEMREGNPQLMLDRGEQLLTPPLLVLHPDHDLNVPRPMVERFVESYKARGADLEVRWFENLSHAFIREPGPGTDQAVSCIKDYIKRRLSAAGSRPQDG